VIVKTFRSSLSLSFCLAALLVLAGLLTRALAAVGFGAS
jgi:hypothetical protein